MATSPPPCLICYDLPLVELKKGEEIESSLEPLTVFTLRCLLQVDQVRVNRSLKQEEGPAAIRLCDECRKTVEQAQVVYEQLLEIGRRFREQQREVVEAVRNSFPPPRRGRRPKRPAGVETTDELRQFVKDYDYAEFKGPLHIKDLENIPVKAPIWIKQEVPDEEPDTRDSEPETFVEREGLPETENNQSAAEPDMEIKSESGSDDEKDDDDMDYAPPPSPNKSHNPTTDSSNGEEDPSSDQEDFSSKSKTQIKRKLEESFGFVRCPYCDYQTENNGLIGSYHVRRFHMDLLKSHRPPNKTRRFGCCGKKFRIWERLHEHLSVKHDGKSIYVCSLCPLVFPTGLALRSHAFQCHDITSVLGSLKPCPTCKSLWKSKEQLKNHLKEHKPGYKKKEPTLPFQCHLCRRTFGAKVGLSTHLNRMHGIQASRKRVKAFYHCPEETCARVFRTKQYLETHVAKVHTRQPIYHCEVCTAGFYDLKGLQHHQESKHGTEKFICEKCGHPCSSRMMLYQHRSEKHGNSSQQNLVVCEICGKSVPRARLKSHIKLLHEKKHIKYLHCHLCGQRRTCQKFLDMHLYSRHQIGERPEELDKQREYIANSIKCQVSGCKQRFGGKNAQTALEKHEREAHGETGEKKPFTCQYCGKGFSNKFRWSQHEMTHTNKETRPFKCQFCGKGFVNKSYARYHELNTHKAERQITGRKATENDAQ